MKLTGRKVFCIFLSIALMLIAQSLINVIGQFWADTITNLILIISVMTLDALPCLIISLAFPIVAKILSVTDLPIAILSVMVLSNIILVVIYETAFRIFASNSIYQRSFVWVVSIIISALSKGIFLYLVVEKFLIKVLEINAEITYSFAGTQITSALIAGVIAFFIIRPVKRWTNKR